MNSKKLQALIASYGRSFIVAASTAYAMGEMNIKNLLLAEMTAVQSDMFIVVPYGV